MERNYAIDWVKGVGLLLVAAMHSNIYGEFNWFANWLVNTEMRFVVPFFFLSSGYLLFQKIERSNDAGRVLRGYIAKIAQYYLLLVVVCYLFDYLVIVPLWELPAVFFRGFMTESFWGDFLYLGLMHMSGFHLWFLLAMLWSGVILYAVCRKRKERVRQVCVAALVLHVIGLFGITQPYSQFLAVPVYPRDALFFGLFYISLGGVWALYGMPVRRYIPQRHTLAAIVILFALHLAERSALVLPLKLEWGELWGEYFITTLPLTMLIFQYALDHGQQGKNSLFSKVGQKSIGVYGLHVIALNTLTIGLEAIQEGLRLHPLAQTIQAFLTIALAYGLYMLLLSVYDEGKGLVRRLGVGSAPTAK